MYAEFLFLTENDTWDCRNALSGQAVLTSRSVFKIEKDRKGKILKFKDW